MTSDSRTSTMVAKRSQNWNTTSGFEQLPIPVRLITAGTAACIADFASFPLDTAKVRLQIQGEGSVALAGDAVVLQRSHYRGLLGTIVTISREEGVRSLYNGLTAGLQRQMCFASIRLGLYEPMKNVYRQLLNVNDKTGGLLDVSARILAGLSTGGMAVLLAQPTDVVKVRFQAHSSTSLTPRYKSTMQAYSQIFRREGIHGLWKGTFPNVGRNAIVNVSEIVCYDLVKEAILARGFMKDNIPCHFTSAVIAGFCATLCASPVDVIKTRYMNSARGTYKGAVDCAVQTFMREGFPAFYKGFWFSFSRLVSWNIVMWITYEQLKGKVVQHYHSQQGFM